MVHLSALLSRAISKFEGVLLEDTWEVIVPKFSIYIGLLPHEIYN